MNATMSRRGFLKLAGVTAAMAAMPNIPGGFSGKAEAAQAGNVVTDSLQVPYSEGRNVPQIAVPANACDCAHHIFDPVRFAYKPDDVRNQPPATVDVYKMLQRKLGLSRSVAINPSAYGFDNRCMLDAIQQLGKDKTHGIAVIPDDISDRELEELNQGGIVGIRYNVSRGAVVAEKKVRRMADRIKEFDWNMHFWMPADIEMEYADLLSTLPVQVVFDHRGHLPKDQGINHPAFKLICNLLQEGKAWVKLSAQYHDSSLENDYADRRKFYKTKIRLKLLMHNRWRGIIEFRRVKPICI